MTLSLSLPTGVLGVGQVQGRVSKHGSLSYGAGLQLTGGSALPGLPMLGGHLQQMTTMGNMGFPHLASLPPPHICHRRLLECITAKGCLLHYTRALETSHSTNPLQATVGPVNHVWGGR